MPTRTVQTTCCIVGGGPAGMMLGFLLARAGVSVTVLEKHADFLRDFRGDTIHPSTLELMRELGLLDEFLRLPHSEVRQLTMQFGKRSIVIGYFDRLPVQCKFIALMPQWDFLNFIADRAKTYPGFDLRMRAEATDLIERDGRVVGVRANTPDGEIEIAADLVVGCDGRHSTVRARSGLRVDDLGAPMDVMWFRLTRKPDDQEETFGRIENGRMIVMLNRTDYWQCAYVIAKGSADEVRRAGLDAFRQAIARLTNLARERLDEIKDWDDVKLLTVAVDRLRRWYRPGLLCIGDAAHAMSPIGGVGINLAVQDAVAAANILAESLRRGAVSLAVLNEVQERREFPARFTQRVQIVMQNNIIGPALSGRRSKPPVLMKMMQLPFLRRIPGRVLALGVRPEHVRTPEAPRPQQR